MDGPLCRPFAVLLLLLIAAPTAVVHAGAFRRSLDVSARSRAFIGYTELQPGGSCEDHLSDCEDRAIDNGCLYDVYMMRRFCPATCSVSRCSPGTNDAGHKVRHKGYATPAATRLYAQHMQAMHQIGEGHWRVSQHLERGDTLHLSSLGMGTHLGEADDKTDEAVEAALVHTVTHGWNVIDTASTYRRGRAESSIGRALDFLLAGDLTDSFLQSEIPPPHPPPYQYPAQAAVPANLAFPLPPPPFPPPPSPPPPPTFVTLRPLRMDITREMVFVSTKAGYVDSRLSTPLLRDGAIAPSDVVAGRHCLHPRCLEASLRRSRERLRLETIDLLYLHDAAEVQLPALGREAFLALLLTAFRYLEEARADGLIRNYGLSTWESLRVPPSDPLYLPLDEVVQLAVIAGGAGHGFKYVQVPMNPAMSEAWTQKGWQGVSTAAAGAPSPPSPPLPPPPPAAEGGENARGAAAGRRAAAAVAAGPQLTLLQAAQQLHVGVFGSSPLLRGELVQGTMGDVDAVLELGAVSATAGKLLQLARSTPGVQAVLVGHKSREYVETNMLVTQQPLLTEQEWAAAQRHMVRLVARLRGGGSSGAGAGDSSGSSSGGGSGGGVAVGWAAMRRQLRQRAPRRARRRAS